MKKICAPDFALEKKTHASDPLVNGVVLLAGMFSFACVFGLLSTMILSITDCLFSYTLIPLWMMTAYILLAIIPCIVLCVRGLAALYTSYAIAPDCITKGTLMTRIHVNTKAGFAEAYFDTDCYKKKDYHSPVLVKETKRAYIYRCEKNKKLTIPKLYTNMGAVGTAKEQGIFKRITRKIGL